MLLYSEYSLDEIANYLAFAVQSYFISTFKKSAGMTPREYKMSKISFNPHYNGNRNPYSQCGSKN